MGIELALRQYSKQELLDNLDPAVARWFSSSFTELTPPQRYAIASIQAGKNTLIASPTGSGKTLSAFLSIIDRLVKLSRTGELEDRIYCVYVSPLRSLNNDISKNLSKPLSEIKKILLKEKNNFALESSEIRVAVRTSDTSQHERSKMLLKPPHILITTPETLAILLVAPKFKQNLRNVKWVIVDEIHELCGSKRGVHLSLSLERLEASSDEPFARIALSATINPMAEVARFLVGYGEDEDERECNIVDSRFVKKAEISVSSPVPDLVHTSFDTVSSEMYRQLETHIKKFKTTLVFTNTRSLAEKVAFHLSQKSSSIGETGAHHSSLSREIRKEIEDKLKQGQMSAVVTSTSLELGLDVGSIDSVVQLGSPKSITRCLQRVGRSGHALTATSKAVLLALDRDDLLELAAISSEAQKGNLDRMYFPKGCLDVLAQHLVGIAVEGKCTVERAFRLVTRSYCYRDLDIHTFRRVIRYLSGGYGLEDYRIYGRLWYDESSDTFGNRGWMTRVIYSTNIGTIPDEIAIMVITRANALWVGEIQEEFLERLAAGDVFVLGGKTYTFCYAKGFKAFVDQVENARPSVPVWTSESLPLSFDLGEAVSSFKSEILEMLYLGKQDQVIQDFISSETNCDRFAAETILGNVKAQAHYLKVAGVLEPPNEKTILVENYIDRETRQNLIFSCNFGRRVNETLSRILSFRISERRKGNVKVTVSDSGFMITLPTGIYVQPNSIVELIHSEGIRKTLALAIRKSEMVRRRFRHCCGRALMILKNYKGSLISVKRQQVSSQILLSLCERLDGFPILEETYREVMEDLMDVKTTEIVIQEIEQGKRHVIILPRQDVPAPFSHNLFVKGSSDVLMISDRKEMLRSLYDSVMSKIYARERDAQVENNL